MIPLLASGSGLYTFGWLTKGAGVSMPPTIKALKTSGESTFYSNEMKISVTDNRIVPTGWSQWAAVSPDGSVDPVGFKL